MEPLLTCRCAQLYAGVATSAEGLASCALFRSRQPLLQAVREPLPHAKVELRHESVAAQQHVQGRALLCLELRVCHAL